ncbi:hypothetical protein ALI144C_32870 [Actinosynnema sp. ALI-1.44]|uniref:hypothetical protein n=1 Tax=Actinosynnema sp. ALI-1.44 TaxID=1933779 RepID=UPI00097C502B|nr:hypothetical protein [Actinosynnema sp. ALI-1.44]ONI76921.1 hypothetical protein ALI144C_32870 [Actinosynnema sp. ALI-1.44]
MRSRFDLVSWDPRGIAGSAAVRCFDTLAEQLEFFGEFPEMPVTPAGESPFYAKSAQLADRGAGTFPATGKVGAPDANPFG